MYQCPSCAGTFARFKEPGKCPLCGIYAGVRCTSCGFSASASVFIDNNDRCPKCGARVSIPGAGWGEPPLAVTLIGGLVALAILGAVLFFGCRQWARDHAPAFRVTAPAPPPPTTPAALPSTDSTRRKFELPSDAPSLARIVNDATLRRDVRVRAAQDLRKLGPSARAVVPELIKSLGKTEPSIRTTVTEALNQIGAADPAAVPALTALLDDPSVEVRVRAIVALGDIGPPAKSTAPALRKKLTTGSPAEAVAIRTTLEKFGPSGPEVIPELRRQLGSGHFAAVPQAIAELKRLGPDAAAALPDLTAFAQSSALEADRAAAIDAIAAIGPTGDMVPLFQKALGHKNRNELRIAAATALGRLGPAARPASVELADGLVGKLGFDADPAVARACINALLKVGRPSPDAAPKLIAGMNSKDQELRLDIIRVVGEMGPDARPAFGAVLATLPDPALTKVAQAALDRIGGPTDPHDLKLSDANVLIRVYSVRALPVVHKGDTLLGALFRTLEDKDASVRREALVGLGGLGAAAKSVQIQIMNFLLAPEPELVDAAVSALAKIGKDAVPTLTQALGNQDAKVRAGSARALGLIGADAKPAARALAALSTRDRVKEVRDAARESLDKINAKP